MKSAGGPCNCKSRSRHFARKRTQHPSSRLAKAEKELAELQEKNTSLTARWESEKGAMDAIKQLQEQLDISRPSWKRPSGRGTGRLRPGFSMAKCAISKRASKQARAEAA